MAISPRCDVCKTEMTDFGALLFSPPEADGTVQKYHVCKACYAKIVQTYLPTNS